MEPIKNFTGFTARQKEIHKMFGEQIRQKALQKIKMSHAEKISTYIIVILLVSGIISFALLVFVDPNSRFKDLLVQIFAWSLLLICFVGFFSIVIFNRSGR